MEKSKVTPRYNVISMRVSDAERQLSGESWFDDFNDPEDNTSIDDSWMDDLDEAA